MANFVDSCECWFIIKGSLCSDTESMIYVENLNSLRLKIPIFYQIDQLDTAMNELY